MTNYRLKGVPVLVTGAGGFIGSHLVERLVEAGAKVRALVHYNALGLAGWLERSAARDQIDLRFGDITDRFNLQEAMAGCEIVFHLAALISIPYSYHAPESYLRTNALGTMNVMQVARDTKPRRIIHASTSEAYGTAQFVPISERHPLTGQSPYSASKIAADKIAESFHLSFGVPIVTIRPFNTYGPRQSSRAIVPTIISQALAGKSTLRLGNLAPTRDLNYVADTVDGFLLAAAADDVAVGRTINLGSGREISIGDLVTLIGKLIGRPLSAETDPERVRPGGSEVERLLADASSAREILGWSSTTSLEAGLQQTIEWLRENGQSYDATRYRR